MKNLHSLWDSVLYEFYGYQDLPYSDADWATLGEHSATIRKNYPMNPEVIEDLDPVNWSEESFEISSTFVYKGVVNNQAVSDEYVKEGRDIAYN